jgi:hypothetical protein
MMPDQFFTATMVGLLKGAPLSVLILLMISGEPQSAEYLQRYSRYSDKVVQQALLFLQEQGLISRNARYAWQLSKYASQLPLMAQIGLGPIAGVENEVMDPSLTTLTGSEPAAGEMDPESGASYIEDDDRDTEILRLGNSVSLARVFNLDSSNTRDSRKEILASDDRDTDNFRILSAALERYGIREPARSRLARMADMTLERIEYHCSMCSPGQAIYRIEHNWPVAKKEAEPEELFKSYDCEGAQEEQEPPEIPVDVLEAWDKTLDQLRGSQTQSLYTTCVYPLKLIGYDNCCLVMQAANQWVIGKLHEMGLGENELGKVFSEKLGSQVSVRFEVGRLWF